MLAGDGQSVPGRPYAVRRAQPSHARSLRGISRLRSGAAQNRFLGWTPLARNVPVAKRHFALVRYPSVATLVNARPQLLL